MLKLKALQIRLVPLYLSFLPSLAFAEVFYATEPLIVTASLFGSDTRRAESFSTVIRRGDIEARKALSVTELLRQVPGLHIDQTGSRGGTSSVYLRGGDPNYALVLIDGVKVNDPTNSRGGSFDFSTLDPDSIERIEIVRGPVSALYGSDAMSGAIHIVTRRGEAKPVSRVRATGGAFGQYQTLAESRGKSGAFDYSASASVSDSGVPTTMSRHIGRSASANLGFVLPTAEFRWANRYNSSVSNTFPDDSGGPDHAARRETERRDADEWSSGFSTEHRVSDSWKNQLDLNVYARNESIDSPGVAPGLRDPIGIPRNSVYNQLRRARATFKTLAEISPWFKIGAGAEGEFERGSSQGLLLFGRFSQRTDFERDRESWAPFAEARASLFSRLNLQAAVRYDISDDAENQADPKVGASYYFPETGTLLRANWGRAFKRPSFYSLSHPLVGNPNLNPEKSEGWDAGASQFFWEERVKIDGGYFYNLFRDAVDFDPGPPPRLVNRSEIETEGAEGSIAVQVAENLTMSGSLTYAESRLAGSSQQLRNRPEWRGGATLIYRPLASVEFSLAQHSVGKVLDSSIPTGNRVLNAWSRWDASVQWELFRDVKILAAVDNFTDEEYYEFIGFLAAGLSPRAGLEIQF